MATQPAHLIYLQKEKSIFTAEGKEVSVWHLKIPDDEIHLSAWAKYFREHYCLDSEIDTLRNGTGLSRQAYLLELIFPDSKLAPGPGVRSGDFTEILISDYLEFILDYWVPRQKYAEKAVRNESVKGVDVLGFHQLEASKPSINDTLIAFEVKAKLTGKKYGGNLQDAIDDSSKDYLRRAYTLNATKRRLLTSGDQTRALIVQRFQNISDHPYIYKSGAAAILTDDVFDSTEISNTTSTTAHNNNGQLELLVIRGKDLMDLVSVLYEIAADEA